MLLEETARAHLPTVQVFPRASTSGRRRRSHRTRASSPARRFTLATTTWTPSSAALAISAWALPLGVAVGVSIAWGLALLTALSWYVARLNGSNPVAAVGEHMAVAAALRAGSVAVGLAVDQLSG